ncbi:hypothetical protein, partial [Pseudomonas sp. RIT357]|uniref:hypothetical protein n=1 Tax=Pseudomonas sp. RIT357 TaxID=1470593 RepID=UPI001C43B268
IGFCLEKRGDWIGAASRPSAGQACSLQKANPPHTTQSQLTIKSKLTTHSWRTTKSKVTTHSRLPPKSTVTTKTPALLNHHEWGRLLR